MSRWYQPLALLRIVMLLMSRCDFTSGSYLRREIKNQPTNATLTSSGFDWLIDDGLKVMMVEELVGQGRVIWVNEWKRGWFDGGVKRKRELSSDGRMDGRRQMKKRNYAKKQKSDTTNTSNNKNSNQRAAKPPKRMKRHFKFGRPELGPKDLPHHAIEISAYDIFISRYGMYIFIPGMMTFTLVFILFLKWKCLDSDLVGIHGASAIFHGAGRRMLHSLSPGVRRDPVMGKMLVDGGGRKEEGEVEEVKKLFRGVTGMV